MMTNQNQRTFNKCHPQQSGVVEVNEEISRLCHHISSTELANISKMKKIKTALSNNDIRALRKLARSRGGLLSNALRVRIWPFLFGILPNEFAKNGAYYFKCEYPGVTKQIQNLVLRDVERVLKRFPPGLSGPQQSILQRLLYNLICSVLQENPSAHYYQGFHDISLTFLLVALADKDQSMSYLCLNRMVKTNLGPHMESKMDMDDTVDLLYTIYAIFEQEDQELYHKIVIGTKCPIGFSLSWVLTWFSHTLPDVSDVFRMYDYIIGCQELVSPPQIIPIFISATLVLRSADKIVQDNTLLDIADMHLALSQLPSKLESVDQWLTESTELMRKYKGYEKFLMERGQHIKHVQHKLWNDESNNNRLNQHHNNNLLNNVVDYASRIPVILFVKHKWKSVSLFVAMTAYFLHSRYR